MAKVIRIVRVPVWDESLRFDLWLPAGAEIFKLDAVFTGPVDAEGRPIPSDALFMLVEAGEGEAQLRRFQAAFAASGVDDLSSDAPVMPDSSYRYVGTLGSGYMLFEIVGAMADAEAPR